MGAQQSNTDVQVKTRKAPIENHIYSEVSEKYIFIDKQFNQNQLAKKLIENQSNDTSLEENAVNESCLPNIAQEC